MWTKFGSMCKWCHVRLLENSLEWKSNSCIWKHFISFKGQLENATHKRYKRLTASAFQRTPPPPPLLCQKYFKQILSSLQITHRREHCCLWYVVNNHQCRKKQSNEGSLSINLSGHLRFEREHAWHRRVSWLSDTECGSEWDEDGVKLGHVWAEVDSELQNKGRKFYMKRTLTRKEMTAKTKYWKIMLRRKLMVQRANWK